MKVKIHYSTQMGGWWFSVDNFEDEPCVISPAMFATPELAMSAGNHSARMVDEAITRRLEAQYAHR